MKTCCSSWSYHRTIAQGKMNQLQWVDECARLGFDGVELLLDHFPSTSSNYLKELKKACIDRFLCIPVVSAAGHLTTPDDKEREKQVREIGRWIDVAHYMGAHCVRFFCGNGAELEAGGEALYGKVIVAIRKIVAMAEAKGIVAGLENHGGVRADDLLKLHRDVNRPWFALVLDTGNFSPKGVVGPETYSSIQQCAAHASVVHAKFYNVLADGRDRDYDWPRIHGILKDAGFRGLLSVEYEGTDPDERVVVRRIADFLRILR